MSQLKKRLVFSFFFVSIAVATIFYAPMWVFFLVSEALILLSLNEFLMLAEKKGIKINRLLGLLFGALIPCTRYFASESLVLVTACLSLFVFNFSRKQKDQALTGTAVTMLGIVYVAWFFSHLGYIRELQSGAAWVFFTVLIVKGGDAGAYFIGKKFGKKKLIEHISPNKSIEGAIGGFVTSVVLALLSSFYLPDTGWLHLLLLGSASSVLAQFGDLAESLIKREAGVKDSGVIPGLGGILDMLDSLLLTIPFVYYYLTFILKITAEI